MEDYVREVLDQFRTQKENIGKQQFSALGCTNQFQNGMHLPFGLGVEQQGHHFPSLRVVISNIWSHRWTQRCFKKEIGMLKDLKVLDLGRNQLSGPIPPELGNLTSLVKINLQSNGLTGKLPPELGNLKYLEELRLDRNKLIGIVPGSNSSDFTSSIGGI